MKSTIKRDDLKCIHSVSGFAPETKICTSDYNCKSCEYDQTLQDTPRGIMGFGFSQKQCIYMRAKLVQTKYCDSAFDCSSCLFDTAMARKIGKESPGITWSDAVSDQTQDLRCRHALTGGTAESKLCANNYDCVNCQYDQMMSDMMESDAMIFGPPNYILAHGYKVPQDYYIHQRHGWARVEYGGRVRVGLDSFGNCLIGPTDRTHLPSLGTRLKAGEEAFILERDDNEVGIKSPINGVVTATNQKTLEHPKCIGSDPYCNGWIMLVDPLELRSDLQDLTFGVGSVRFIEAEAERLLSLISDDPRVAAATGGEPITDVYGMFKDMGWERVVKSFI
jgi:glycine cleavage system H lipoate-binding protein